MLTVEALNSIGAGRYKVLLPIVPPRPSRDGDEAREPWLRQEYRSFGTWFGGSSLTKRRPFQEFRSSSRKTRDAELRGAITRKWEKKSVSKFRAIVDAKREPSDAKEQLTSTVAPYTRERPKKKKSGRRSDPGYKQANAYIPRELHLEVKLELMKEGKGRQYSELVEQLLQDWVASRG